MDTKELQRLAGINKETSLTESVEVGNISPDKIRKAMKALAIDASKMDDESIVKLAGLLMTSNTPEAKKFIKLLR
jgi:hypothetical protein